MDFKPFTVFLEIPVEELNIRELELIALVGFINNESTKTRTPKIKSFQELEKLLKEKFENSSLFIGNEGIEHIPTTIETKIGRGGSHIWITRKNLWDISQKEKTMCNRTMMIINEYP